MNAGLKTHCCGTILLSLMLFLPPAVLSQGRSLKKIYVGVPSVSMGNIIIFFAKEAKLFEKHGLDAEVALTQGSGLASKALITGNIQISPIAPPMVMNAVLAGSDLVILGHTIPGVAQFLMVRLDIKKTEALKGKTVGVTTFGSFGDFLVRHLAKIKGLIPDKGFALLQTGGDVERLIALKQGRIQASNLSHPGYILAQRAGFTVFWDFFKEVDYPSKPERRYASAGILGVLR
jgi:ABC-type nitrate/sulfonate/bicarbonate transport system substrate-binding protein